MYGIVSMRKAGQLIFVLLAESFPAPLGAELDKDPSIDGTSIGAGSQYAGSSDAGINGLRKPRLEDIEQDERAVSARQAMQEVDS